MDNLKLYNAFRSVPDEAKKTIQGGKLKGFTDINPMWRIKMLTDAFGPCGFGWYIESENHWTDSLGNEIGVFCKVALKVKHPQTGEWSAPIIGIGGSKLAGKGKGDGIDDEAYKMAYTDAISIACKNLGMAADIYYAKDRTKYNSYVEPTQTAPAPAKEKPTFDSRHPLWQKSLDLMVAGKGSIAELQKTFTIPAHVETQITDYIKAHTYQK
jgi:hypothetical protein